ncbi:MAG: sigma-70 family RNA polymerase sigma factor [Thermodesulfobacteriota bacterium]
MNQEESDLILRCQKGDQGAFKEIFDLYHKKVYRIAYGMVREREDALDIVQEVFIKLFRSIRNFRGKSKFYTYLYRMTMNTAIDHARKMGKSPQSKAEEDWAQFPDTIEKGPDRLLLQKELEERVNWAMRKLPGEQRTALLLREVEGLSYKEMAEIVGCSIGTIMSRLHYGRKKIQQLLGEELGRKVEE